MHMEKEKTDYLIMFVKKKKDYLIMIPFFSLSILHSVTNSIGTKVEMAQTLHFKLES